MSAYRELLIGCGHRRERLIGLPSEENGRQWHDLTTLDNNPDCNPDILFDLRISFSISDRMPFDDEVFDEIHAYEVLEHCGMQGDHLMLFTQFEEFWRILKPGGHLFATVPDFRSMWAFGDPSHTRIINRGTLVFLSQKMYEQVGKTPMTDFRSVYRGDFEIVQDGFWTDPGQPGNETYWFVLKAIKPSRRTGP